MHPTSVTPRSHPREAPAAAAPMPRMPTIAAERRAARAELRATRRDAAMTTAEQAARTERLRELLRQGVQRHRRLVNVARDMHEQLQEAAHARAALVVANAALVAQRDTAEDGRARLAGERVALLAERADLGQELERIHAEREQERTRTEERVDFILEEKFEVQAERDDFERERDQARRELAATRRAMREENDALREALVKAQRERDSAAAHACLYYAKYAGMGMERVNARFNPEGVCYLTIKDAEQK